MSGLNASNALINSSFVSTLIRVNAIFSFVSTRSIHQASSSKSSSINILNSFSILLFHLRYDSSKHIGLRETQRRTTLFSNRERPIQQVIDYRQEKTLSHPNL